MLIYFNIETKHVEKPGENVQFFCVLRLSRKSVKIFYVYLCRKIQDTSIKLFLSLQLVIVADNDEICSSGLTAIFEVFKLPTTKCKAEKDTIRKHQFNHVLKELEQGLKFQDR